MNVWLLNEGTHHDEFLPLEAVDVVKDALELFVHFVGGRCLDAEEILEL